ncbi:MAG: carbon starvation protein A [Bacteroides sp.]|nr:carbon starvation protein A [Bacteroides sp.]MCM1412840.1 carbon starvation protein A [Bacteroides sp.]MCM1471509.1 carbon starvation protein A [Bacteroides sp.]
MTAFLISLAILIGGYFLYGAFVDRLMGTDPNRPMPANTMRDDIDYRPMKPWRVFLIQFLNIAGLGPIFGAIMGIMFGPAAFLWIALGTIFAGAVHDFCSGVISIRKNGASLPEIVGNELGVGIKQVMRGFSVLLLILVAAVFVVTPAGLMASMTPDYLDKTFWLIAIFSYYILATLLPIDKLIGNLYPLFGFALLFMAAGILFVLIFTDVEIPVSFADSFTSHQSAPVFPMMFVSIACGAISGFHATQSPMMARCLTNEKLARPIFYGAMVAEGIVALIWAAAAVAFTGGYEQLAAYMAIDGNSTGQLVHDISFGWLGKFGGILAILGVVAAPITTGDTALRSARLTVADFLHFSQRSLWRRLAVALPIFALTAVVMMIDFTVLWRYFAWCNQTLSVFTLWAVTVYLARHRKAYIISLCPAIFMTVVCTSYLLCAPSPEGLGLSVSIAVAAGLCMATVLTAFFFKYVSSLKNSVQIV